MKTTSRVNGIQIKIDMPTSQYGTMEYRHHFYNCYVIDIDEYIHDDHNTDLTVTFRLTPGRINNGAVN